VVGRVKRRDTGVTQRRNGGERIVTKRGTVEGKGLEICPVLGYQDGESEVLVPTKNRTGVQKLKKNNKKEGGWGEEKLR